MYPSQCTLLWLLQPLFPRQLSGCRVHQRLEWTIGILSDLINETCKLKLRRRQGNEILPILRCTFGRDKRRTSA